MERVTDDDVVIARAADPDGGRPCCRRPASLLPHQPPDPWTGRTPSAGTRYSNRPTARSTALHALRFRSNLNPARDQAVSEHRSMIEAPAARDGAALRDLPVGHLRAKQQAVLEFHGQQRRQEPSGRKTAMTLEFLDLRRKALEARPRRHPGRAAAVARAQGRRAARSPGSTLLSGLAAAPTSSPVRWRRRSASSSACRS